MKHLERRGPGDCRASFKSNPSSQGTFDSDFEGKGLEEKLA